MRWTFTRRVETQCEQHPVSLPAAEAWEVRWASAHSYLDDRYIARRELEVFPTKEAADIFARNLKSALTLLGDTADRKIKVKRKV